MLSLADSYYRCYRDAHPNFPESDSDLAFMDPMMRSKSFDPRVDRNKRVEKLEFELREAEAEVRLQLKKAEAEEMLQEMLQQIQAREELER